MPYTYNPFTRKFDYYEEGSSGDVAGPISATDNAIVRFDGTTGKAIQDSTATIDDTGKLTIESGILELSETTTPTPVVDYGKIYCKVDNKLYFQDGAGSEHDLLAGGGGGSGDVVGPSSATDNAIARYDSTTGKLIQGSSTLVDDSGHIIFPDAIGIQDASLNQAVLINDAGSVELYYDGTKVLSTWEDANEDGISLGSSDSVVLAIETSDNDFHIKNLTNSGDISIESHDSGGTLRTLFSGAPDGRVSLFYGPTGTRHLETHPSGVIIRYQLSAIFEGPSATTQLEWYGNDFRFDNSEHGGRFLFFAEDTGGTPVQLAEFDPDGAVDLYYAGTSVVETYGDVHRNGIAFGQGKTGHLKVEIADGDLDLENTDEGGSIHLIVNTPSYGSVYGIDINSNGRVVLYGDGAIKFETRSDGVMVRSGNKLYLQGTTHTTLQQNGTSFQMYNYHHGGSIEIYGETTSGVAQFLFDGDPDGSVDLYYDGVKKVETTSEGFKIDSALSMLERSSDPTQPSEGECIVWMSDGTGKGDDGDVMIASTAGGTTNYTTLFDHSAGTAW